MEREKKKEEVRVRGSSIPPGHPSPREAVAVWPLGGGSGVGLVVAGDGDAPLAAARFTAALDLRPVQGQQAVGGQAAADGCLVHAGREAVPAAELSGDVAVIILGETKARLRNYLFFDFFFFFADVVETQRKKAINSHQVMIWWNPFCINTCLTASSLLKSRVETM